MASCTKLMYVYKEILSALRKQMCLESNNVSGYRDTYGYSYITSLYRNRNELSNNVDSTKHLQFLAETYLCLLKSIQTCKVLYERYKGGEDSVEKIATKVGFKLPSLMNEHYTNEVTSNVTSASDKNIP